MAAWGMVIEPKKNYKQNVKRAYKITQAVLNRETAGSSFTDLLLTIGDKSFIACSLNAASPQCALNLKFPKGDKIAFSTRGEGAIHLTGYTYEEGVAAASTNGHGDAKSAKSGDAKQKNKDLKKLLEKTMSDSDSDDMDYSQLMEDYDGLNDESGEEEEDDDDEDGSDDDDGSDDQDGEDDSDDQEDSMGDDDDDDDDDDDEAEDDDDDEEVKPPPSKKEKKEKQPAAKKQEKKEQQPQMNGTAATKGDGKFVVMSGGTKIKDMKEGTGAFAKPGKKVAVYYEGRLQGKNQIFDSCKQGNGFSFVLGRGTVIKGWDVGVAGMRVGGKRQIICPPNVAYGTRGSPPVIPPNSTLVFDVELKNVK